jgi:predicted dehydrogenase
MYRHHPRIIAAKEMVRKGVVGKLGAIEAAFTFVLNDKNDIRYQPEMGGGALLDVGCYCVNIIRLMAGHEPVTVQGRAVWAPSGVDDQLTGILDFGDGLIAHFDCAFTLAMRQRCIIAGTEGYLGLPFAFTPGLDKTEIIEKKGGSETIHAFDGVDEYRLIAEDFMRAIPSGKAPYPAEDALANMRVLQCLLTSAKQDGQPVKI